MLLQNNQRLHPQLRETGCYFLTLLWFIEKVRGYQFEPEEANAIFEICMKYDSVSSEARIINPDAVIRTALRVAKLEESPRIVQIGQRLGTVETFWSWVPKETKPDLFAAMESTGGKYKTHWVSLKDDASKIIDYDSYNFTRVGEKTKASRIVYYKVMEGR